MQPSPCQSAAGIIMVLQIMFHRCQDGDSPSQYYNGALGSKGRPRKRKAAPGSPEDMQVQTMRMASSALGEFKSYVFIVLTHLLSTNSNSVYVPLTMTKIETSTDFWLR